MIMINNVGVNNALKARTMIFECDV